MKQGGTVVVREIERFEIERWEIERWEIEREGR
jgi:hypothetical protein